MSEERQSERRGVPEGPGERPSDGISHGADGTSDTDEPSPSKGGPFRFRHEVSVRFSDIDVGGHAHHSRALLYMEEARAAYWREVARRPELEDIDYVVAEVSVRFRRRILYPGRLGVEVRVNRLGRKHFHMEYRVVDEGGEVAVTAHSVQVMYDYGAGAPKALTAESAARIRAFEGLPQVIK